MQRQNLHQQFAPQHKYVYGDPSAAQAPRTDGFTVFRTSHGDYLMNNYNNYELFSNNAFIPPHHVMQQQPAQEHAFYHPNNMPMGDRYMPDSNNTNLINSLVDSWMPNMSGMPFGEYTPFGESPLPPQNMSSSHNSAAPTANCSADTRDDYANKISAPSMNCDPAIRSANACSEGGDSIKIQASADSKEPFNQSNLHSISNAQASCTNGNFQCDDSHPIKPMADVKKPRMVAEVKPMRMSYSDVLSKNVFMKDDVSEALPFSNRNSSSATNLSNGQSASSAQQKPTKSDKSKLQGNNDKKSAPMHDEYSASNANMKNSKSTPSANASQTASTIKTSSSFDSDSKSTDIDGKQAKKKSGATATNVKNPTIRPNKSAPTEFLTKKRSQSDLNAVPAKEDGDKSSPNNGYFYKTEPIQADKPYASYPKSSQQRKQNASNKQSMAATATTRTNPSRTDKSNVYQQKRSKTRKTNTYELALKLAHAWINYMLFFFKWLIALVADVFLLSVGIIWDYISSSFDYTRHILFTVRNELTNNSGRPYAYFANLWQKFDNKFNKESKWAVWRRLFSKKKPPETIPDYYKNGRLPQTGDEAMYSLLNCKGKDAYRLVQLPPRTRSCGLNAISLFLWYFQYTRRDIRLLAGTDS